jgi:hypothetical protein
MPTPTPNSQAKLATDAVFLRRLGSLLTQEAQVVAGEVPNSDPTIASKRRQLAQSIINNPGGMAASLAPTICNATNFMASDTSFNFEADATVTSASDGAIRSQIATLWNILAGV